MPNEDYMKTLEEARALEEIEARIPSTADNRDELIKEQLVQREEQRAQAKAGDGAEGKHVSEHDGARFFTKAALEAHDKAFFPEPPKRGGRKATPVPVQVVDTGKPDAVASVPIDPGEVEHDEASDEEDAPSNDTPAAPEE